MLVDGVGFLIIVSLLNGFARSDTRQLPALDLRAVRAAAASRVRTGGSVHAGAGWRAELSAWRGRSPACLCAAASPGGLAAGRGLDRPARSARRCDLYADPSPGPGAAPGFRRLGAAGGRIRKLAECLRHRPAQARRTRARPARAPVVDPRRVSADTRSGRVR